MKILFNKIFIFRHECQLFTADNCWDLTPRIVNYFHRNTLLGILYSVHSICLNMAFIESKKTAALLQKLRRTTWKLLHISKSWNFYLWNDSSTRQEIREWVGSVVVLLTLFNCTSARLRCGVMCEVRTAQFVGYYRQCGLCFRRHDVTDNRSRSASCVLELRRI